MNAPEALSALAWPVKRGDEMLRGLSRAAGFAIALDAVQGHAPAGEQSPLAQARAAGMRTEQASIPARGAWAAIRAAAPAVLEMPGVSGRLAIVSASAAAAVLWTPSGRRRVPVSTVEDALWAPVETGAPSGDGLGALPAGIASGTGALRILRVPLLKNHPLAEAWKVRPMATRIRDELRAAKLGRRFAAVAVAYLIQFALLIAVWNDVGARALGTATARGWGTFCALLAAWVVVQLGASRLLSHLALDVGAVLRSALVRGALRLDRDRVRTAGMGQLLGRALEAEVLDVLAIGGGVEAGAAVFELLLGAVVLGMGAAPLPSLAVLAVALLALGAAARMQARRLFAWSRRRRELTHELVERMVGHRTALVQDRPAERQAADRAALDAYDGETRALDRWETILAVAIPRLALLSGLAALAPLLLAIGPGASPSASLARLALSVGGVLLVHGALRRLGAALPTLAMARDAWTEITPLIGEGEGAGASASASAFEQTQTQTQAGSAPQDSAAAPLVIAQDLGYHYPGRPAPVLTGVNITIDAGARVLVQGSSGGGKSTLAALLTGLREPTTGQLRLHGRDQPRVGLDRWRRTIAGAPQFHDNHVFCADLLFNVLMGRRWPPRLEDLADAERVCRELGLGPLLERMPAGLQQQVGETGWRLSHGERSRLFVARSLLQRVEARVLDESFAALDPETLDAVLTAVLAHPEALIVIAHP